MDGPYAQLIQRSAEKGNLIYPGVLLGSKSRSVEDVLSFIDGQYKLAVETHDDLWIECLQEHLVDRMTHKLLIRRYPHLDPSKNVHPKENFPDFLFYDPGKILWDPVLCQRHRRSADLLSTSAEFRKRASRLPPGHQRPPVSGKAEERKEAEVLPGPAPRKTPSPDSIVNLKESKDAEETRASKPLDTPTSNKKRKAKQRSCPITGCGVRFIGSVRKHINGHMPVCLRPSSENYTPSRAYSQARCLHYFAKHILQKDDLSQLVTWLNAQAEVAGYEWNLPEDLRFEMEDLARHMEWPITDRIKVGPANHPASLLHWRALALLRNALPDNALEGLEWISSLGNEKDQAKNNPTGSSQKQMSAMNMQTHAQTAGSHQTDIHVGQTPKGVTTTAPSGSLQIHPTQAAMIPTPARPSGSLQILPALVANILTSVAAGSLQIRPRQRTTIPTPVMPSGNLQQRPGGVATNPWPTRPSGIFQIPSPQATTNPNPVVVSGNLQQSPAGVATIPWPIRPSGIFQIPPQVTTIPNPVVLSGSSHLHPAKGAMISTPARPSGSLLIPSAQVATIPTPAVPSGNVQIRPAEVATISTPTRPSGTFQIPSAQVATIPNPVVPSGSSQLHPAQGAMISTPARPSGTFQIRPCQVATIPTPAGPSVTSPLGPAQVSTIPTFPVPSGSSLIPSARVATVPTTARPSGILQLPPAQGATIPRPARPLGSLQIRPSQVAEFPIHAGSFDLAPPSKVPKLYGLQVPFQTFSSQGSKGPSLPGAPENCEAPIFKAPTCAELSASLSIYTASASMAPNPSGVSDSLQVHLASATNFQISAGTSSSFEIRPTPAVKSPTPGGASGSLQPGPAQIVKAPPLAETEESLQLHLASASKALTPTGSFGSEQIHLASHSNFSTSSGTGMLGSLQTHLSPAAKDPCPVETSDSLQSCQLTPMQVETNTELLGQVSLVRNNKGELRHEHLFSAETISSTVNSIQNSSRDASAVAISGPLQAYDSHFHLDHLEQETGKQGHDAMAAVTGRSPRVSIELCGGVLNYSDPAYFNQIHFPTKSSFRIAVGIHPCHAFRVSETDMSHLNNHLCDLRVCAISEVGLDYSCPKEQWNCQKVLLRIILDMGVAGRVLILRLRADETTSAAERPSKECLKIMSDCKVSRHQRIHLHLCDLTVEEVALWRQSYPECYFGFSSSSEHFGLSQQEALKLVPQNRVLLESNAPFLPIDLTTKSSSPAYIGEIAQLLAQYQHSNLESILRSTTDNAICLYGPWRH